MSPAAEFRLRRALAQLCCGRCGAPGPHAESEAEAGGATAVCARCQGQAVDPPASAGAEAAS